MTPTKEQEEIIKTDEDLKIVAYAGAGKTSTLHMYIKSRAKGSRILYLAFNKSVQLEAMEKFKDVLDAGIVKLDIKTAHSMAYGAIIGPNKAIYKEIGDINIEEIMDIVQTTDYVFATHIRKAIECFCQSKIKNIDKLDYLSYISVPESLEFAEKNIEGILYWAKHILGKMFKGEIRITHDFYLKLYQLKKPILNYDYILFDEAQDASELMLDIVQSQKAIKLFVGDSHQQIYSWRNAVDSLKKVDGKEFKLTSSWRFPSSIATLASSAVLWKEILDNDGLIKIVGMGTSTKLETKAIIGRTNAKLITRAIKDVLIDKTYTKPYFEGGFHNYAVKNAFSVVDDILAIKNKNLSKIKSKKLKHLKDMDDLLTFINQCEDAFLSLMVELVNTYGKNLPDLINKLERACVSSKYDADIIFSSLHKSKGMEYDEVTLLDDFIGLQKLVDKYDNAKDTPFEEKMKVMLNEEINLLYVGITRSKNKLNLSKGLLKDLTSK